MAGDYETSDKVTNLDENLYAESNDEEYLPIPIQPMRLEYIYGNDKLIQLYTGLLNTTTFHILCDNLGVPINNLQYCCTGEGLGHFQMETRGPPRKHKPHDDSMSYMYCLPSRGCIWPC